MDKFEQYWLNTFITDSGTKWIGLSDRSIEGTYQWTTNEQFKYDNWDKNQPG